MRRWRRRSTEDFSAEIAAHIAIESDRLIREQGMPPDEALSAARRAFGNRGTASERFYESGRPLWIEHVRRDAVYAVRTLRKTRGFTMVVLITLSVGIASVTTVFSFINTVFFHPLPYPEADRTVGVYEVRADSRYADYVSPAAVAEIRRATSAFDGVAAYHEEDLVLSSGGDPTDLVALSVDSALMPMLGIRAERGRLFAADDYAGGPSPVIISDELWRRRFGADEHLVGTPIRAGRAWHTVIGVIPPGLRFPRLTDLWFPLPPSATAADSQAAISLSALARLRRGESREAGEEALRRVAASLISIDARRFRGEKLFATAGMVELRGGNPFAAPVFWEVAGLFIGGAACVMLIVCANVGALMLVRGAERRREMAIRASLGSSRGRLIQQSLTESLILAIAAGAVGAFLTLSSIKVITASVPLDHLPSWMHFGIDTRVLLFSLVAALLATVAFGLLPAREGTRFDLAQALKAGGDTTAASGRVTRGARNRVVLELALSFFLVLTTAAGWRTYQKLASVDLGYERGRIVTVWATLNERRYPDVRSAMRFAEQSVDALMASPAVESAAMETWTLERWRADPLPAAGAAAVPWTEDDHVLYRSSDLTRPVDAGALDRIQERVVSARYFQTLGLALRQGRWFQSTDDSSSASVAIVSEHFAHTISPGSSILGQMFRLGPHGRPITIIGVVSDVMEIEADPDRVGTQAQSMLYTSDRQALGDNPVVLVVRARGQATTLSRVIPIAMHSVDPDVPADEIHPLEFESAMSLLQLRVIGAIMGAFALAALGLAMLGTYGVIAYDVSQRTREIGIRIALGGSVTDVMRWIIGRGLRFIVVGLALGLVLAAVATRVLGSLLWGFSPASLGLYVSALVVFGAIGILACYIPARRVTRTDPMSALRAE